MADIKGGQCCCEERINKMGETFEPVEITILLESEAELAEMWMRMNVAPIALAENQSFPVKVGKIQRLSRVWFDLDCLIRQRYGVNWGVEWIRGVLGNSDPLPIVTEGHRGV